MKTRDGLSGRATARRYPLMIFSVLFSMFYQGLCYDYAVQPSPVQFTRVPQSQTVLMGETVTLTCNFTIIELGSSRNYPVPSAVWRLNGTHNFKPTESDIRRGYLHTELVVESIEAQDAGYYECLAVDGKKRKKENQKAGEGRYIASSPRAYLQVVCPCTDEAGSGSGSNLEPYRMGTSVTLHIGEVYLAPCDVSLVATPFHVDWYRNGTALDQNMILSNGSLLLPHVTAVESGLYQCMVQFGSRGDCVKEGPQLEIHVTEDPSSVEEDTPQQLILDPPTATLTSQRDTLSITCYITGLVNDQTSRLVIARDDRELGRAAPSSRAPYKTFYVTEPGTYECRLVSDGSVTTTASVTVVQARESLFEKVIIYFVDGKTVNKTLTCGDIHVTTNTDVYWYQNGQLLRSNDIQHILTVDSPFEFEGIYQCFRQSSDGELYEKTWRVFESRFTNPPADLQCKVKFSKFNYPWPKVEMQWKLPDFIADRHPPGYHAYSDNGIIERKYVASHMYSTEFELGGLDDVQTTEEVYDMFVRTDANRVEYWSAPAICPINTLSRALNPPLPLEVSCSSEEAIFTWTNPLISDSFNLGVQEIGLNSTCLYGNHSIYKAGWFYDDAKNNGDYDYYYDDLDADQPTFDLTLRAFQAGVTVETGIGDRVVPNGAVCVGWGTYKFDHGTDPGTVTMPRVMCLVPPVVRDDTVRLGLLCHDGVIEMTWNTSLTWSGHTSNITLHLSCLNLAHERHELFYEGNAGCAGSESVVTDGQSSLCSFHGSYTDTETDSEVIVIEPAQCYMDQPIDSKFYYPPVRVPSLTEYTLEPPTPRHTVTSSAVQMDPIPTSTRPTPSNHPESSSDDGIPDSVLHFAIPSVVVLVAIACVLLLIVVLRCRYTSRYNASRLHFYVEQELNKDYQPFNPRALLMDDGMSLMTIYDDGHDWGQRSSPPPKVDLDSRSNSESTGEEMSERLKDGETPVISPLIVETVAEDSGCDLQFELCAGFTAAEVEDTQGKEHLFNRFLTGIEKGNKPPGMQVDLGTKKRNETLDFQPRADDKPTSSSIAHIVAERLHMSIENNAAPPSSGYGTMDGYKCSTDSPDVGQEYLARKLQEVEEMAQETVTTDITPQQEDMSTPVISSHSDTEPSNHDNITGDVPSLVLTPPQHSADDSLVAHSPTMCAVNAVTSASTGDISCSGSYYQDNEGYLHMSPARQSGLNPPFHQSLDTFTKSL